MPSGETYKGDRIFDLDVPGEAMELCLGIINDVQGVSGESFEALLGAATPAEMASLIRIIHEFDMPMFGAVLSTTFDHTRLRSPESMNSGYRCCGWVWIQG